MAMTPMFVLADPLGAFLSTAGALAFYTFLLLPTALRFDFRRDLDRLALFKSLPIPSRRDDCWTVGDARGDQFPVPGSRLGDGCRRSRAVAASGPGHRPCLGAR